MAKEEEAMSGKFLLVRPAHFFFAVGYQIIFAGDTANMGFCGFFLLWLSWCPPFHLFPCQLLTLSWTQVHVPRHYSILALRLLQGESYSEGL